MKKETITKAVIYLIATIILGVSLALPIMLLWNLLIPDIFNLPKIGFFQALGLYLFIGMFINFKTQSKSE